MKLNENTQSDPVSANIKLPRWLIEAAADYGAETCPCGTDEFMKKEGLCDANTLAEGYRAGAAALLERVQPLLEALEEYASIDSITIRGGLSGSIRLDSNPKPLGEKAREALEKFRKGE